MNKVLQMNMLAVVLLRPALIHTSSRGAASRCAASRGAASRGAAAHGAAAHGMPCTDLRGGTSSMSRNVPIFVQFHEKILTVDENFRKNFLKKGRFEEKRYSISEQIKRVFFP